HSSPRPTLSTVNTFEPADMSWSETKRLSPSTSDSTEITDETPMITPSRVRNERSLLARSDASAIPALSRAFMPASYGFAGSRARPMPHYRALLFVAQRDYSIDPRCAHRGLHARA